MSAKHNTDPDIQVHWYDEHTVILRQNMAINYEAPFMFLLFGGARAVLIDTGATASSEYFPLRTVIDDLVAEWLARHSRAATPLLVSAQSLATATTSPATDNSPDRPRYDGR